MPINDVFWSHFEEPVSCQNRDISLHATKTRTAAREERDQDDPHGKLRVIPSALGSGTKTFTETREEPDQDRCHEGYSLLRKSTAIAGTKTFTKTKEESDQDEPGLKYLAIPKRTRTE